MLKLEAGKRYWMRYGGVSGVVRAGGGASHPFTDGMWKWTKDGNRFLDTPSEADLVRKYTEPQPLEWKRGIPTEEECRECWIVTGGTEPFPDSGWCVYQPGELDDRTGFSDKQWYIALRIKPIEPPKPKTKTVTLQQFTHTSGDKRWMIVEDGEMAGCWTATGKTKTVEVPCE